MVPSTVVRFTPRPTRRPRVDVLDDRGSPHGRSDLDTERCNGKGHDVEIVRTEPRDLAPVIPLPVRMHGNRVIQPLDVPVGTLLDMRRGNDRESYDAGPLARALMAVEDAPAR